MRHFIGRMRRLVYAFSKSPEHHRAAVALGYVHYNLCHVVRTLRVTPAMAAGITDHVWDAGELCEALLSAIPCDAPKAQSLAPRKPETTARELPGGRGFLRVVGGASAPAAPSAAHDAPPAAPAALVAPVEAIGEPTGQLDLLAWRPRPTKPLPALGSQLDLFEH